MLTTIDAIMIFFHSLGGTISLGIAQALFLGNLNRGLSIYVPSVDPAVIISSGPTNLFRIVAPDQLSDVLRAYTLAITGTFIFSIVTGAIAFLASLWLEWKDLRGINILMGS